MITTAQMYWLVTMDSIVHASAIIAVALGVMAFLTIPMVLDDDFPKWTPSAIALAAVAFALVAAFVPTTRQMAAIVMVPKIANNEKVQAAGNKLLYDLAVEWMDELRPRKKAGDEEK